MPIIENIHPFLTADDLYEAWLRQNPAYRKSLFDGKVRAEIQFRAYAKIWERVMLRVFQFHTATLTCKAFGALKTSIGIQITWTQGTTEGFTIKSGQILVETPWGVRYRTTEDLTIGAAEAPNVTRIVGVESEFSGFEYVVAQRDVNEFAIPLDLCDELAGISWDVGVTETAKQEFIDGIKADEITVTGVPPTVAGALGTLDLIASEKGLPRAPDEGDLSLRKRLKRLPRTVTRQNILDEVNDVLAPFGVSALMVEGFEQGLSVGEWVVGDDFTASPASFCIIVPNLDSLIEDGIIVSEWIVGESFTGDDTSVVDGILAAVDEVVQKAKLGGVCAVVIQQEAP